MIVINIMSSLTIWAFGSSPLYVAIKIAEQCSEYQVGAVVSDIAATAIVYMLLE